MYLEKTQKFALQPDDGLHIAEISNRVFINK
jgi:hypothetical protein